AFSYPDPSPFCTTGVTFTWDGQQWLAQLPIRTAAACVASAPGAAAPPGRAGAGQHTVCGVAGARFRDCKTVTIVAAAAPAGAPAAAPPPPAPDVAPTAAPPAPTPSAVTARPLAGVSAFRRYLAWIALLAAAGLLVLGGLLAAVLSVGSRRRALRRFLSS